MSKQVNWGLRLACRGSLLTACLALTMSTSLYAEELQVIELEGSQIRGNQELPTVSFLVPWQAPAASAIEAAKEIPVSLHVGSKLERTSFQRLLRYHQLFVAQPRGPIPPSSSSHAKP